MLTLTNIIGFAKVQGGGAPASTLGVGDRGIVVGGSSANIIDYFSISTPGNASDFGDFAQAANITQTAGGSDGSRGVTLGGNLAGSTSNVIAYITIGTTGNSSDFGDLLATSYRHSGCSDTTFALNFAVNNVISYITIASAGNATDFGDLTVSRADIAGTSDGTYGICIGGDTVGNTIDYVTIATPGNASDWGDVLASTRVTDHDATAASTSRCVWMGGKYVAADSPQYSTIQYINTASTGNASDFGDLVQLIQHTASGQSDGSRGCASGGSDGSAVDHNVIQYITIDTPGASTDFGDLTWAHREGAGFSGD